MDYFFSRRNNPYDNLIRFAGVVLEGLGDGSLQVWVTMEQGFQVRSGWPRAGLGSA